MKNIINKFWAMVVEFWSNLKSSLVGHFRFVYSKTYLIIFGVLNLAAWGLAAVIFIKLPADRLLILHSNILFGIDLISPRQNVFLLPAAGLLVTALNIGVGLALNKKDVLARHLLLGAAVIFNLFMLLSVYSAFTVNYIN